MSKPQSRMKHMAITATFIFIIFALFTGEASAQAIGNLPVSGTSSYNWSGYVATGGYYTSVGATWNVPTSLPSGVGTESNAEWVGIGGQTSADLIQAGTIAIVTNGQAAYHPWVEILPNNSEILPMSITPGDSVSVVIRETSTNNWNLSFRNNTTNAQIDRDIGYVSSHSSAEWIEEAPVVSGTQAELANFNTVNFTHTTFTDNGIHTNLGEVRVSKMTMINHNTQAIAAPSEIGPDLASFSVQRVNTPQVVQASAPVVISYSSLPLTQTYINPTSSIITVSFSRTINNPVLFRKQTIKRVRVIKHKVVNK
jgi:hypothetical protein